MPKIRIKLISLGSLPYGLKLRKLSQWKSSVYEFVDEIDSHPLQGNADLPTWGFSDQNILLSIPSIEEDYDFLVAIANVPLEDNYYSRRLSGNKIAFTFFEIRDILSDANVPMENALLKTIYAYCLVFKSCGSIPPLPEVIDFLHDETRSCLFDMNGVKDEIVYSASKPILCQECKMRLTMANVAEQFLRKCSVDIRHIRKGLYYQIYDEIKSRPIVSLFVATLFAVIVSILSNAIYDLFKLWLISPKGPS